MTVLLAISPLGWVGISFGLFSFGLATLVFALGAAAAGSREDRLIAEMAQPASAEDWLAEDEIDWSQLKVERRVASHTVDRGTA